MRRRVLLVGVAAVAAAVTAVVPVVADRGGDDYPAGPLRVATGPLGGVYHAYGAGLAEAVRRQLPRLDPAVSPTAASVQNCLPSPTCAGAAWTWEPPAPTLR